MPPPPIASLQLAAFAGSPRARTGTAGAAPATPGSRAARLANGCGHLAIRVVPQDCAPPGFPRIPRARSDHLPSWFRFPDGRSRIRTGGALRPSRFPDGYPLPTGTIPPRKRKAGESNSQDRGLRGPSRFERGGRAACPSLPYRIRIPAPGAAPGPPAYETGVLLLDQAGVSPRAKAGAGNRTPIASVPGRHPALERRRRWARRESHPRLLHVTEASCS